MSMNLNSTKSHDRPSHEALENKEGDATDEHKIDKIAMESAKRGQERIKHDEAVHGEIFTK